MWMRRPPFSTLPGTKCGLGNAGTPNPCPLMVCAVISSSLGGSFQELADGLEGHYGHELPGQ